MCVGVGVVGVVGVMGVGVVGVGVTGVGVVGVTGVGVSVVGVEGKRGISVPQYKQKMLVSTAAPSPVVIPSVVSGVVMIPLFLQSSMAFLS